MSSVYEIFMLSLPLMVKITMIGMIMFLGTRIWKEFGQQLLVYEAMKCMGGSAKGVTFTHTWIIENFSTLLHMNTGPTTSPAIHSKPFGPPQNDKLKFRMELYPRGDDKDSVNYVSLYLNIVSTDSEELLVSYSMSIINAKGKITKTFGEGIDRKLTKFTKGDSGWGRQYFISAAELLKSAELMPDDKLTLHCMVLIIPPSNVKKVKQQEDKKCVVVADLFDNEKLADVVLAVGDREWPAHKFVLAARSPVFADMFRFSMKESTENEVDIPDADPVLFEEMLKFIYTGKISSMDKLAMKLLPLADKFQVDSLKKQCEQYLCSQITTESALDMHNFSRVHNARILRERTCGFIRRQTLDAILKYKDNKPDKLVEAVQFD